MSNEYNNVPAENQISTLIEGTTNEEREAMVKAAKDARIQFHCESLRRSIEQKMAFSGGLIRSGKFEDLRLFKSDIHQFRKEIVASGDRDLVFQLDSGVLGLIYSLVANKKDEIASAFLDEVSWGLTAYHPDGQQAKTLRCRIALVKYALDNVVQDERAESAADAPQNPGNTNFAVYAKIVAAVEDKSLAAEAVEASRFEVNRQIWTYLKGNGNNAMYLLTACENLALSLLSVGEQNPLLMNLTVLLNISIRRGG